MPRRRTVKRKSSLLDLDFPKIGNGQSTTESKSYEIPKIETEGLSVIAKLLQSVRSADELEDLKVALNDALRIQKQTIVTPRKPSSQPPEFVDGQEEEIM